MPSELGIQSKVVAALSSPALHGGASVKKIETHAAVVFLAGDKAIKIKRAVQYPFLDYSTLALRKRACEAELAVNRRFAPQIYRGVLPICELPDGSMQIGGHGTIIEWAVEMARFDDESTLDKLAGRNLIDEKLAIQLADAVLAGHRNAPLAADQAWIAEICIFIDQNNAALLAESHLFAAADVQALTARSIERYRLIAPMLAERGRSGFARRCHGDLHLGNIALIGGAPVLFDAIEFNPAIATGDVLYDLAFLLMDLIDRGERDSANMVFNRYLSQAHEASHYKALAALPLFLSLRAAIRAKVAASRAQKMALPAEKDAAQKSARNYFKLANDCLAPPHPLLMAVGGLSGTGKSVLARLLAPDTGPAPGAVILRSDVERKKIFGVADTERLPEDAYSAEATQRVYAGLAVTARTIVTAGHSVVADAVYADESERTEIEKVAIDCNVPFVGLFLQANLNTRLSRVRRRTNDASDADQSVVRRQTKYHVSYVGWQKIDANGTPAQTLNCARKVLTLVNAASSADAILQ